MTKNNQNNPLAVGKPAPNFSLQGLPDRWVSLKDYVGQTVVLLFCPADFCPACNDELTLFNEALPEFQRYNTQLIGISADNVWSHLVFSRSRNLHFPLLSDFHPKGEVSRAYHAYREDTGETAQAMYVIDENGKIAWGYVAPEGVRPGADGVLSAVESLRPAAMKV